MARLAEQRDQLVPGRCSGDGIAHLRGGGVQLFGPRPADGCHHDHGGDHTAGDNAAHHDAAGDDAAHHDAAGDHTAGRGFGWPSPPRLGTDGRGPDCADHGDRPPRQPHRAPWSPGSRRWVSSTRWGENTQNIATISGTSGRCGLGSPGRTFFVLAPFPAWMCPVGSPLRRHFLRWPSQRPNAPGPRGPFASAPGAGPGPKPRLTCIFPPSNEAQNAPADRQWVLCSRWSPCAQGGHFPRR